MPDQKTSAHQSLIGIFGGRFDPVHRAHIKIAQTVADTLGLSQIRWVVTGDPEHKPVIASPEHRFEMVRLALEELHDPRMIADDREIKAANAGRSNFTADTLLGLQKEFPANRFILILGEDQLQHFMTWSRWEWLVKEVSLAVCARPGAQGSRTAKSIEEAGGTIHWIEFEADPVSSTEVRNRIQSGTLIPGLIPVSVADYIATHFLYH